MTCNPRNIIKPATGKVIDHYQNGGTSDIIEVIMKADKQSDRYIDRNQARCLIGSSKYETARNIWRFVKSNIKYRPDRPGHEVIKTPGALFDQGTGDCKSFSVAEVALLRALGFKNIRYRFAAYAPGDYTHVYVVCTINGQDVILDAVYSRFDAEARYAHKKDIPAALPKAINGFDTLRPAGVRGDLRNVGIGAALLALLGYFLINQK